MTPQIQTILDLLVGDDFPYPVAIHEDHDFDMGPILAVDAFDLPDDAKHQVLLSLCCPSENEAKVIAAGNSSYSLVKRGGYISNPEKDDRFMAFRKRSVFMFDEGSIFPNEKIRGVLHNLKPEIEVEHPIWRDGRAFTLPINPIWND